MRSEAEMMQLFLDIANADHRILAVYMNGSRTNPNVERDIFQDYDIVFVVIKTQPFILGSKEPERSWISQFGNILYMQYPDEHPDFPNDEENFYGWLMQFDDGNRVDLHVESVSHAREHICDDKLCRILLDKEKILPPIPEATDEDYHIQKPSRASFWPVPMNFGGAAIILQRACGGKKCLTCRIWPILLSVSSLRKCYPGKLV